MEKDSIGKLKTLIYYVLVSSAFFAFPFIFGGILYFLLSFVFSNPISAMIAIPAALGGFIGLGIYLHEKDTNS